MPVVAMIVVTLLLVAARMIESPVSWPQVQQATASWFGDSSPVAASATAQLLISDEFTSPDSVLRVSTQAEGWTMEPRPQSGVYYLRIEPGRLGWSSVGASDLPAYYAETSLTVSATTPAGVAGLLARRQGADSFYLFAISGSGDFQVQLMQEGNLQSLTPWLHDIAINRAGAPNSLAVQDDGEFLRFFVNNILFYEESTPQLPIGDVGVFGAAGVESATEVDVDWFHIYALPVS
ncbi:MAG TPA: hypothetical protein PKE45_17750 [Caldilineaceae bacterium]|nr:hypothetical protein [Caldilineaceae bacterium]